MYTITLENGMRFYLSREVYSDSNKKVGKIQSVGIKKEYRGNELAVEMMWRFTTNYFRRDEG